MFLVRTRDLRAALEYFRPSHTSSMTNQEKKRLSAVLRATEYLFLENIALKLIFEHREVPNWQKLLEHIFGGQRDACRGAAEIQGSLRRD